MPPLFSIRFTILLDGDMRSGSSYTEKGGGKARKVDASPATLRYVHTSWQKKEKEMNVSTPVAMLWQRLTSAGLVLVFIGLLTLLVLIGLVGAGIGHASQGVVLHGSLMAGGDPPVITHHAMAPSRAASNGNIQVG